MPPYLLLGYFFWKHLEASKAACSSLMHFAARISETQAVKSLNSAPAIRPGKVPYQLNCSRGDGNLNSETQVMGERAEGFCAVTAQHPSVFPYCE